MFDLIGAVLNGEFGDSEKCTCMFPNVLKINTQVMW